MKRTFTFIILLQCFLLQLSLALPDVYATAPLISGKVIAIDTKTGFLVHGYTIELDDKVDRKALRKVKSALITKTGHRYRDFKRTRSSQFLVLIRKESKLDIKVGDHVEIKGYSIIGDSEAGSKTGDPVFSSFKKTDGKK